LPWNATPVDKAKYKLCKDILAYEQDNNLTTKEVAKQLGLNIYRTEYILYSHIDKLTLDELISYANTLQIPRQLRINIPYGQTAAKTY
jgi:hypothetical protein